MPDTTGHVWLGTKIFRHKRKDSNTVKVIIVKSGRGNKRKIHNEWKENSHDLKKEEDQMKMAVCSTSATQRGKLRRVHSSSFTIYKSFGSVFSTRDTAMLMTRFILVSTNDFLFKKE